MPPSLSSPLDVLLDRIERRGGLLALLFLAGCLALAVVQRLPGLFAEALSLDDQWVASAASMDWSQVLAARPPAPIGFIALLKAFRAVIPGQDLALLLPAFLAGLAAIPAMYALGRQVTGRRDAACLLALLPVFIVNLNEHAARAKQYGLEFLLTAAILSAAAAWLAKPRVRTFAALGLAGLALVPFSFTTVTTLFPAANLAVLLVRGRVSARDFRSLVILALALDAVLAAIYLFFLRGQSSQAIFDYWQGHYLTFESWPAFREFLGHKAVKFFSKAFPRDLYWMSLFVPLGLYALIREEKTRPMGVILAAFYLEAVALSFLRLYPMGGQRTDVYSYPATLLCGASAFLLLPEGKIRDRGLALALALATVFLVADKAGDRYEPPPSQDRRMMERLAGEIWPEDGLIIWPHAQFAAHIYGPWPVRVVPAKAMATNFEVEIDRENTCTLPSGVDGRDYRKDPAMLLPFLNAFFSKAYPRVYFFVSHPSDAAVEYLAKAIEAHYYLPRTIVLSGGGEGDKSLLYMFVRDWRPRESDLPPEPPRGSAP